ncbi:MAG TPA: class I SAM-dependent methyltransferase [Methylomirabilota bacterium]|jgi:SAM-dependent methyltransferase|nr:class I SAM-dependent methyltransferase [Methylomirabilota bacterium]
MAPLERPYLREYLERTPVALGLERALECEMFRGRSFTPPVLDVGCGDGMLAEILFGSGGRVTYGLDPDRAVLAQARERGAYRLLLNATGDAIPLADGACGSAYSNSVLEHIEHLEPTLREIRRVLRDGGELLVTVPTDRYERYFLPCGLLEAAGLAPLSDALRARFNRFWRHHHCYPPEEWRRLIAAAGFEILESSAYGSRAVCRLLAFSLPVALPAFATHRLLGRWMLVPRFRALIAPALAATLSPAVRASVDDGALVFIRARASGAAS